MCVSKNHIIINIQMSKNISSKEVLLYKHVKNALHEHGKSDVKDEINKVDVVLKSFDDFCWEEGNWMMHVGDVKGKILDELVKKKGKVSNALELGSYMGYSAIRQVKVMREKNPDVKFYGVDPNVFTNTMATNVAKEVGYDTNIKFLTGTIDNFVQLFVKNDIKFDIVFIDHVKD